MMNPAHNFSVNDNYVDVNGRNIQVLVCENTGNIVIPVHELKRTGFSIYHKSQYNKLQLTNAFECYLLDCALTYVLECQSQFSNECLLQSIEKCKQALLEKAGTNQKTETDRPLVKNGKLGRSDESPSQSFRDNHQIGDWSANFNNFTITTPNRVPSQNAGSNSSPIPNNGNLSRQSFNPNIDANSDKKKRLSLKPHQTQLGIDRTKHNDKILESSSKWASNESIKSGYDPNSSRRQRDDQRSNSRPYDQSSNGRSSYDQTAKVPIIRLNQSTANVVVTNVEKPNVVWAQDLNNAACLSDLEKRLQEPGVATVQASNLTVNVIYITKHEDLWYRCKMVSFKPKPRVALIDYGKVIGACQVFEAPDRFKNIPSQAVKIILDDEAHIEVNEQLTLEISKQNEGGTVYAKIVPTTRNKTPTPQNKTQIVTAPEEFFNKPAIVYKLENNQKVMVIDIIQNKLVLRTKDSFDKSRMIDKLIENYQPELIATPAASQLVLVKENKKWNRGIVLQTQLNSVQVEFLDRYMTTEVPPSSIAHISKQLSNEPITYFISPELKGYKDTSNVTEFLNHMAANRGKATVKFLNGEFDLMFQDGSLFSEKFNETDDERVLLESMSKYEPPIGVNNFVVYSKQSDSEITISPVGEFEKYGNVVINSSLDAEPPYDPTVDEMCYCFYDAGWSRAVVLGKNDGKYEVKFVDFGNVETLGLEQIRQFTDEAKATPIIGFSCRLNGSTANIEEFESYDFDIKKSGGDYYEAELAS